MNNDNIGYEVVAQILNGDGTISEVRRGHDMITEQFYYKGFTFQRMTKDLFWYVCYNNQIVNCGKYRNDLIEWVDSLNLL